jgi:hypothetical protein
MSADADSELLTARSVQGYFVNSLARQLGTSTNVRSDGETGLALSVVLPN